MEPSLEECTGVTESETEEHILLSLFLSYCFGHSFRFLAQFRERVLAFNVSVENELNRRESDEGSRGTLKLTCLQR